jgi:hypothetical protein
MAKIIANGTVTVELTTQDVELIRQALRYSVRNNTGWENPEDHAANEIARVLSGGTE